MNDPHGVGVVQRLEQLVEVVPNLVVRQSGIELLK